MARAYGSSAHLLMKRENTYGQAATGNYVRMPFNRCNLGSEQCLKIDAARGSDLAVLAELLPPTEGGVVEVLCGDRVPDDSRWSAP
jgi:hypothetical protein